MKTETKNLDKCQVQITVSVDAEAANAIVKDVEKRFMQEASLPGFRKGKVPLALIRKNFATMLEKEICDQLVTKNYKDAVKDAKLEETFVALTNVKDIAHDEKGATFTLTIEVKPTFKVPTYKGLKLTFNDTKVKDEEVQEQLKRLREACAKYEEPKEGDAVAEGDFVQINFAGTIDGKPVAEVVPDAKPIGEAKDFWMQVLEGRFLPEILEALKGMKVGEKKADVKVKFGKDFQMEALRGKKAVYEVEVKSLRKREMPDDAAFLEQLKPQYKENAETLEKLTEYLRGQMQTAADNREQARRENEVLELLSKKVDFDVPSTQVLQARDNILQSYAQQAQYSGRGVEYFKENREKILKEAEETAERQVRIWYVIDAIAKAEKLDGTSEDVGKKVIDLIFAAAKK